MKQLLLIILSVFALNIDAQVRVMDLHNAVVAVCPIDGVDSSGKFTPKAEATPEQIQAAEAVIATYSQVNVDNQRRAQLTALQQSYQLAINNINTAYPAAGILVTDDLNKVSAKMLMAGMTLADVGAYGGQLKLIDEAIKALQEQLK